jgi:hypothetical protein
LFVGKRWGLLNISNEESITVREEPLQGRTGTNECSVSSGSSETRPY